VKKIDEYWFLAEKIDHDEIVLNSGEIHHMIHVLRIQPNTQVLVTDGKGRLAEAMVASIGKKNVSFSDIRWNDIPALPYCLHMAIAPTKNISRFEWFLEKATEIGITEITPIITQHSERANIRPERLEKIIVAAAKQSKKAWIPKLNATVEFSDFIATHRGENCFIAYIDSKSKHLKYGLNNDATDFVVLVGPEGGFSENEFLEAVDHDYKSVSLGRNRLRTETAGVVATQIVAMHFD